MADPGAALRGAPALPDAAVLPDAVHRDVAPRSDAFGQRRAENPGARRGADRVETDARAASVLVLKAEDHWVVAYLVQFPERKERQRQGALMSARPAAPDAVVERRWAALVLVQQRPPELVPFLMLLALPDESV